MDRLIDLIATITGKDKTYLAENLDSTNIWDSLTRVEIIINVEEEYDIMFEQEEIAQINTINKLANIIESKS